jgi:hypothetical protein
MLREADLPDDLDALRAMIVAAHCEIAKRDVTLAEREDRIAGLESAGAKAEAEIARLNAINRRGNALESRTIAPGSRTRVRNRFSNLACRLGLITRTRLVSVTPCLSDTYDFRKRPPATGTSERSPLMSSSLRPQHAAGALP